MVKLSEEHSCRWASEWPRNNDLWKSKGGCEVLMSPGAASIGIDGRALGLRIKEGLVQKPWIFFSNDCELISALRGHMCNGRHSHVNCRGSVAVAS
eukprot:6187442-Amphidinium_carterae.1